MTQTIAEPPAVTIRTAPGPNGRVPLTDQPGEGPQLLLLHGFPDALVAWFRLPARPSKPAAPQSMFATAETPTDPAPATERRGVR